jgi:hypothetical protein
MSRAVDPSKLEMIKSGKKTVNVTGVKENKNTISNKDGKFMAIEKEKKFEEAGVTRKKRNFVMYESKLGTEKETDLLKLAGAKKKAGPRPKVEETIISKVKRKEYLDNFQYHETKDLKNQKPSVVVHTRVSDPRTGTVEESSYFKSTRVVGGGSGSGFGGSATNSYTSTTKVGRRGGAGGATSSTTTKTSTRTTSSRTRF